MTSISESFSSPPIMMEGTAPRHTSKAMRQVEELVTQIGNDVLSSQITNQKLQDQLREAERILEERITRVPIPSTLPKDFPILTASLACPQTLPSFDYAFVCRGDLRGNLKEFSPAELPRLLEEWGYTFHRKPEPGDFALFLEKGVPVHMGVCHEGNRIESKWTCEMDEACLHQAEDTPTRYGSQILYCRPPNNLDAIIQSLVEESSDSDSD